MNAWSLAIDNLLAPPPAPADESLEDVRERIARARADGEELRPCGTCGVPKMLEEFYVYRAPNSLGYRYSSACRECIIATRRQRRSEQRDERMAA